jgi:hypothetical protein
MQITVKVFPTLKKYLRPQWADQGEFTVFLNEIPAETKTIRSLIAYLQLPEKKIGQVILNGHIKWDKELELHAGDRIVLSIFVGGG